VGCRPRRLRVAMVVARGWGTDVGSTVERTYLFVAPEEAREVEALGGQWDVERKCWYVVGDGPSAAFARWMPDEDGVEDSERDEFNVVSDRAFVASATVICQHCAEEIEVICIYCEAGNVCGEALAEFSVFRVSAIGEELVAQMGDWPQFRLTGGGDGFFANHRIRCGGVQDELYLHTEPGDVFFDVPKAPRGVIRMAALVGIVRLSGDESFQVG